MEPKIERTAFNSQRDQIFWHLYGFLIGLWQRQSLLLSKPIRYKRHTTRRAALSESYHLCKYLHLSFPQMEELRLGVRSWYALSVQFCCRTAKTFVVSLTDFYLSANNTCQVAWSGADCLCYLLLILCTATSYSCTPNPMRPLLRHWCCPTIARCHS